METIQQNYSFGTEFIDDFGAKQNLLEITGDRIIKLQNELNDNSFYSLQITYTPSRLNYHKFNFEKLQEISRKLINGMTSYGGVPNRKFFKKYFQGGIRTISIYQETQNEYPSFTLNYLIFSEQDNLDVRIKNQIIIRLRMIDPTLEVSFTYIGKYNDINLEKDLTFSTEIDFNSGQIQKLGHKNIDDIYNNQFQRPRFFGKLFRINKLT